MKLKIFTLSLFLAALVGGGKAGSVQAALSYGNGYYTNLCDSGTAATYYNCDPGCEPSTGSCRSSNSGVVKWVCTGKWNQCLESESQWSNFEQVDNVSCGYTVQLSLFDKKCRREDGSWDNSCRLLGYMVWYSGDCSSGGNNPGPTSRPVGSVVPTVRMSPTVTPPASTSKLSAVLSITPTIRPSPTSRPSGGQVARMCGLKCGKATDCQAGFACVSGFCRNPACPEDRGCFCGGGTTATASAVTKKSPDTGLEVWVGMVGMLALGWAGLRVRRMASKLW